MNWFNLKEREQGIVCAERYLITNKRSEAWCNYMISRTSTLSGECIGILIKDIEHTKKTYPDHVGACWMHLRNALLTEKKKRKAGE